MKKLIFVLFTILAFSSCKKEPKTVYVSYKITETSAYTPTYIVSYTLADGTTKTIGGLTANKWISEKITAVEIGKYLSLSVEGNGGGIYEMFIYVNGTLDSRRDAGDGHGAQTLNTQIQY